MKPNKFFVGDTYHGPAGTQCSTMAVKFDITGRMIECVAYILLYSDEKVNKGNIIAELNSTLHCDGMSFFYEFIERYQIDDAMDVVQEDPDNVIYAEIVENWERAQNIAKKLYPEYFKLAGGYAKEAKS